jgi:putative membrane protein
MPKAKLTIALILVPGALAACAHEEPLPPATATAMAQPAETAPPQAQPPPPPVGASQMAVAIDSLPQPDRDFVKQIAASNLAAIRFGELAANKGSTIEMRSLGREMVDTHTGMSDQLRTSARTEGLSLPMPQMTARQQRMYDELSKLSGPQFDETFQRDVMELQQEAIAAFQNEAVNGKLSELAMLANQALPLINQRVRTVQNQMHRM